MAGIVDRYVQATLYPTAGSWYMDANVPGKTRVFLPFIGGVGNAGTSVRTSRVRATAASSSQASRRPA
jgi:hypothetical protein